MPAKLHFDAFHRDRSAEPRERKSGTGEKKPNTVATASVTMLLVVGESETESETRLTGVIVVPRVCKTFAGELMIMVVKEIELTARATQRSR